MTRAAEIERGSCSNCGAVGDTLRPVRVVERRNPRSRRSLLLCANCREGPRAAWRLRWTKADPILKKDEGGDDASDGGLMGGYLQPGLDSRSGGRHRKSGGAFRMQPPRTA